ncbi:MAG: HEAT repeat domain-containing protein [Nitrospirae bacterium]|nr:HEAT repeat domain-containing protein [Nitrospirota bacterium]
MARTDDILLLAASDNPDERREAALAMSECGTRSCIETLLDLLCDPDWRVRKTAVETVLQTADESIIPGLVEIMGLQDNAGARNSAIEALTRMGRRATSALMEVFRATDHDRRKFIIDILGEVGDKTCVPLMAEALDDPDENVSASAVEHLGAMGDSSVVPRLVGILRSGVFWKAYPAADALGRIGDPSAVGPLVDAIEIKSLREPAIRALGRIGDSSAIPAIVPHVAAKSKAVQAEALKALTGIYRKTANEALIASMLNLGLGESAYDQLLKIAKGGHDEIKEPALVLLGLLEDDRAIGPLLEMASTQDSDEDARRALVSIGRAKPSALADSFRITPDSYKRRVLCIVAGMVGNPLLVPPLIDALGDPDGHVRGNAAEALGRTGAVEAISGIESLMSDCYQDVQETAIRALARLRHGLSIERLTGFLHDRNPVLRRNYAFLIGLVKAASAVEALSFAMKDEEVPVRMAAVEALAMIGGEEAAASLPAALTDEASDIRRAAVLAMGRIGRPDLLERLAPLFVDQDDWVRAAVAEAIAGQSGPAAGSALIRLFDDASGLVRVTAIEMFGMAGHSDLWPALLRAMKDDDPEIRRAAVTALSLAAPPQEAASALLPSLHDRDWAVRKAAVEAMRSVGMALGAASNAPVREELRRLVDGENDPAVLEAIRSALDASV